MGTRNLQITLDNNGEFKPGDRVRVAIPEASLVWTSIVVYLSPLLLMFLLGGIGDALFGANELVITLMAVFGLILGFLISRKFAESRWVSRQRPKIIRSLIDSPNPY
jgi:positive regulator of sigma E activity